MAKKVSKWFRIGVEGDTCDGRVISADDIQEMADTFDPRVYGCRINLEHIKSLIPDSPFIISAQTSIAVARSSPLRRSSVLSFRPVK